MDREPKIRLIVLKSHQMDSIKDFYELLGFRFQSEKHGSGPQHYSAPTDDAIIEVYPLPEDEPVDSSLRLGFGVANLPDVVSAIKALDPSYIVRPAKETPWGVRAVVRDPDLRAVELYESVKGQAEPAPIAGSVKQVIVVRHDLKMRRGKQIAQGAHAAMAFLTNRLRQARRLSLEDLSQAERYWMTQGFAKICCRVDSEEELLEIYQRALDAGLVVEMITDSGKTEFHGEPTRTCIAIGPDRCDKIDPITEHLKLL